MAKFSSFHLCFRGKSSTIAAAVKTLQQQRQQNLKKSNRIQRENDSYGALATFDHELSTPQNKFFKPYSLSFKILLKLQIKIAPQNQRKLQTLYPNFERFTFDFLLPQLV